MHIHIKYTFLCKLITNIQSWGPDSSSSLTFKRLEHLELTWDLSAKYLVLENPDCPRLDSDKIYLILLFLLVPC